MISEINELALGIDLGPVNSQLTFYNRQNSGPRTVSVVPGEEKITRSPRRQSCFLSWNSA